MQSLVTSSAAFGAVLLLAAVSADAAVRTGCTRRGRRGKRVVPVKGQQFFPARRRAADARPGDGVVGGGVLGFDADRRSDSGGGERVLRRTLGIGAGAAACLAAAGFGAVVLRRTRAATVTAVAEPVAVEVEVEVEVVSRSAVTAGPDAVSASVPVGIDFLGRFALPRYQRQSWSAAI